MTAGQTVGPASSQLNESKRNKEGKKGQEGGGEKQVREGWQERGREEEGEGTFEGDMDTPTIHKYTSIHADYMYGI